MPLREFYNKYLTNPRMPWEREKDGAEIVCRDELDLMVMTVVNRSFPERKHVVKYVPRDPVDIPKAPIQEARKKSIAHIIEAIGEEELQEFEDEAVTKLLRASMLGGKPTSANSGSYLQTNLRCLWQYVTTYMPIRLLSFELLDSELKISLMDTDAIYGHLSSKMLSEFAENFDLTAFWKSKVIQYAILSHTWEQTPGELTYGDWQKGVFDISSPKSQKLYHFCQKASEKHGLTFGWIDTVCIDKKSSTELDESIRSMYKWYSRASVCIVYLASTENKYRMEVDPWFTRGWTLQEMIAPRFLKFYNKRWEQLNESEGNDKRNPHLLNSIAAATRCSPEELHDIHKTSISRRMRLAAGRKVTREEDIAYSLMGIFNVSIPTAYGEGSEHAFFRLVKEIFDSTHDVSDIFNWGGPQCSYPGPIKAITSLFPSDPSAYTFRSHSSIKSVRPWRPIEPYTLTHLGLRVSILLMPFQTFPGDPIGDYYTYLDFLVSGNHSVNHPLRDSDVGSMTRDDHVHVLAQKRKLQHDYPKEFTRALGIMNAEVSEDGKSVYVPKSCFAILLEDHGSSHSFLGRYQRVETYYPLFFALQIKKLTKVEEDRDYFIVKKSQLANHGMELLTLYL